MNFAAIIASIAADFVSSAKVRASYKIDFPFYADGDDVNNFLKWVRKHSIKIERYHDGLRYFFADGSHIDMCSDCEW